jgi:hypothetical protein
MMLRNSNGKFICEPIVDRFWMKVDRKQDHQCWLWTGNRNVYGYGVLRDGATKLHLAHRFSYALHNGSISPKMVIRHKCDTPACVNPNHLEEGTQAQNIQDVIDRSRPFGRKSRFSKEQIHSIKVDARPYRTIALDFHTNSATISRIKNGQGKAYVCS